MIKAYHARKLGVQNLSNCVSSVIDPADVSAVGLIVQEQPYEEVGPSRCTVEGRLKNSEMLLTLSSQLAHLKRALLQNEVQYMLENHITESSSSPWSSPCLLVIISDGTY